MGEQKLCLRWVGKQLSVIPMLIHAQTLSRLNLALTCQLLQSEGSHLRLPQQLMTTVVLIIKHLEVNK